MAQLYDLAYTPDRTLESDPDWSGAGDLAFASGQLSTAAGPGFVVGPSITGGGGDIEGAVQYVSHSTSSGVLFACDDTLDNGYIVYRRESTALVTLGRRVAGVTNVVSAATIDLPQTALLEFKRYGNTIEVFVDGASVIFYTDSTPFTGTRIGLFVPGAATWSAGPTIADTTAPAGETGLRYVATAVQGTGDGRSAANAAAIAARFESFAGYLEWLVANDAAVAASGLPSGCAVGIVMVGGVTYDDSAVGWGNGTARNLYVTMPATRRLCVVGSTDALGTIPAEQDLITASPVVMEGGRPADPRGGNYHWPLNATPSTETRYIRSIVNDDLTTSTDVAVAAGQYYRTDTKVVEGPGGATQGTQGAFALLGAGIELFNIRFRNYGAALVLPGNVTDLVIRGCEGDNARQFFRTTTAGMPGLRWLGARAFGCEIEALKLRAGDGARVTVDHIDGRMLLSNFGVAVVVDVDNPSTDIINGVTISPTPGGAGVVERIVDGDAALGVYLQGDGIVTNEGVAHVAVSDLTFRDLGDGGIDVKPHAEDPSRPALAVTNVVSERANRCFRVWGDSIARGLHNVARLEGCTSRDAKSTHLFIRPRAGRPILLHVTGHTAVEADASKSLMKWEPETNVSHVEVVLRSINVTGMNAACPVIVDSGNNNVAFVEAHSVMQPGSVWADYNGTVGTLGTVRKLATHASMEDATAAGAAYVAVYVTDEVEPTLSMTVDGVPYQGGALPVRADAAVGITPTGGASVDSVTLLPSTAGTVTDNGDGTYTLNL